MPSSCNEIVKQLVWNSLMKGLVLKVKLIYVMSAWSQSCSVIFRECALRRTAEWSPQLCPYWQGRKQMKTAASSSARQSAGSAKSSWGKQLAYGGPRGDSTGWEEEDGTEQWQSSGHKTCPTKTQHSPRFTSLPLGRGTERERTFLFGIFKMKTRRYTSATFLSFNRHFFHFL